MSRSRMGTCWRGMLKWSSQVYSSECAQNQHTDGRPSYLQPCLSQIIIKVSYNGVTCQSPQSWIRNTDPADERNNLGSKVFEQTCDEDKQASSIDDRSFLEIMDREVYKEKTNWWVVPVPFRQPRHHLRNNRKQAEKRLSSLKHTLERTSTTRNRSIGIYQYLVFITLRSQTRYKLLSTLVQSTKEFHSMMFFWADQTLTTCLLVKSQLQSQPISNKCSTVSLYEKTTLSIFRFLWYRLNNPQMYATRDFQGRDKASQERWRNSKVQSTQEAESFLDKDSLVRVGACQWLTLGRTPNHHSKKTPHLCATSEILSRRCCSSRMSPYGRCNTLSRLVDSLRQKKAISSVVHKCITCRKIRGKLTEQKMSDLPSDRLTPGPPFTQIALDVFGPWNVTTRRTRGVLQRVKDECSALWWATGALWWWLSKGHLFFESSVWVSSVRSNVTSWWKDMVFSALPTFMP